MKFYTNINILAFFHSKPSWTLQLEEIRKVIGLKSCKLGIPQDLIFTLYNNTTT